MGKYKDFFSRIREIAQHKYSIILLIIFSFTESFLSPIPPDLILASMVLLNPSKMLLYVSITTISSIMGGIIGYILGYFFFIKLFMATIIKSGHLISYQEIVIMFTNYGLWTVLIAGFISPLPYKLCTISAGLVRFNFCLFLCSSIISRGLRFLLISFILQKYNEKIKAFLSMCVNFFKYIMVFIILLIYFQYFN